MSNTYGMPVPGASVGTEHRAPARYLVIIDADGVTLARLCTEDHAPVAEFDAGTEEVLHMTRGLSAARGAAGPEWDRALAGHNAAERAAAQVFTLDV